jgi:hypothetical protein
MPEHHVFITEYPGDMNILVGCRDGTTAFVTQRNEIQSDMPTLRPGALVSVTVGGELFSILFLHLKSFDTPRSWGLRDDMIEVMG